MSDFLLLFKLAILIYKIFTVLLTNKVGAIHDSAQAHRTPETEIVFLGNPEKKHSSGFSLINAHRRNLSRITIASQPDDFDKAITNLEEGRAINPMIC